LQDKIGSVFLNIFSTSICAPDPEISFAPWSVSEGEDPPKRVDNSLEVFPESPLMIECLFTPFPSGFLSEQLAQTVAKTVSDAMIQK
jgi:hypothetical protein